MKTRLVVLCSSALLSIATLPALAEDNDSRGDRKDMFASLDSDADGQLTKEEVASHSGLADSFTMIDRNSDGYISKGEFRRNVRSKPADR
jgi:Ca2+-binding EF-hand superfamily protein